MLTISRDIVERTTSDLFQNSRHDVERSHEDEFVVGHDLQTSDGLEELHAIAVEAGDGKLVRAIDAIRRGRLGDFAKPVPNFKAFQSILTDYLMAGRDRGWIFKRGADDRLHAELVTSITFSSGEGRRGPSQPTITIHTASWGAHLGNNNRGAFIFGLYHNQHSYCPVDVTNRRIAAILAADGIQKETPELLAAHDASIERYQALVRDGFAQQFDVDGAAFHYEDNDYRRRGLKVCGKVIHDSCAEDLGTAVIDAESSLFPIDLDEKRGLGSVPEIGVVRVFDLRTHEFYWCHADVLTPHVYDKTLRAQLILPATHIELLDVLTTDLNELVADMVEGKSSSNVILCKGAPGLGKTLTAEVYAEEMGRPLLAVHAGTLGTTAVATAERLQEIFLMAKRWEVPLLLDECDVFVAKRADNIEQNAICAEFLRTFEYFDGLVFATTNRVGDIDDAFIQRCAVILMYEAPDAEMAARVWRGNAKRHGLGLADDLIAELVDAFPGIAPRDVRELFRLTTRMTKRSGALPTIAAFRKWAVFRAIKIAPLRDLAD